MAYEDTDADRREPMDRGEALAAAIEILEEREVSLRKQWDDSGASAVACISLHLEDILEEYDIANEREWRAAEPR